MSHKYNKHLKACYDWHMKEIIKDLNKLKDEKYKDFTAKLIPNINKELIIGVRTPELKAYAKSIFNTSKADKFIKELPHTYLEEYSLHVSLINRIKDYKETITEIDKLLPYVDNWAVCDSIKPISFNKHHKELIKDIKRWLKSKEVYTRRFAIGMLMAHYLNEDFDEEYLKIVSKVKNDDYYIMMMCAWYYATALAKQYDATLPYLLENILDKEVHNKTIQKAIESYRISSSQKDALKALKRK